MFFQGKAKLLVRQRMRKKRNEKSLGEHLGEESGGAWGKQRGCEPEWTENEKRKKDEH